MKALPAPRGPHGPTGRIARDSKEGRLLVAFLEGRSFNKFEAARRLRDWCVNTTVSVLQLRHGIVILSEWEVVAAVDGTKTARVKRYSLPESSVDRALGALGMGGGDAL